MRRAAWLGGAALVALAASVAAAAFRTAPEAAEAQTQAVEIKRSQRAAFLPARTEPRPLFVLAIGSDAREGVCMPVDRCLADSIHIVAVNTSDGSATILGFPRDSWVEIPGHGDGKINDAMRIGGPELLVETVERLTDIPIDHYLLTSFDGLRAMVDTVGGLTVPVPYDMFDESAGTSFEAGPERLDGKEALAFARDRKSGPNGDFDRSENQGTLMLAALEALRADVARGPGSLFRWIVAAAQNIQTDLSFTEVFDLALTALSVDPERVANLVVPGSLGFVGDASVVHISKGADDLYADIRDDGVVATG